jgi:hypothetical protein
MSSLDYPAPPPLPKSVRLVHFGNNGRPVAGRAEVREAYLERQRRSSERQTRCRAEAAERVVPFEDHLKAYFALHMINENTHG